MFPASFEYHRAGSVKEAISMLQQYGEDGKLLAGGHSLIPMMKLRLAQPAHLVDIGGIRELASIREEGGKVVIGGLVTHHAVEISDIVRGKLGMLAECASVIGDIQVRNRGPRRGLPGCSARAGRGNQNRRHRRIANGKGRRVLP